MHLGSLCSLVGGHHLNLMQISSPVAVWVVCSDAGPSRENILVLFGRKEWRGSHALAWGPCTLPTGLGEKHQTNTSSLYLSQRSRLSLLAWSLKQRSYSTQASGGYCLKAMQIRVWYCVSSEALFGLAATRTPANLFQASSQEGRLFTTLFGFLCCALSGSEG